MTGYLLFAIFAGCLIIGVPIAFGLGIASLITLVVTSDVPLTILVQRLYAATDSFPMMAIPYFIVAGSIMERGGLSRRLIDFCSSLVGPVKGGLGYVTVLTSMFFAAISGSGPATTAAVGSIMIPAMEENNYHKPFATSLTATAGALGPLIPPSVLFVTFGVATNVSIGALFMSGVIPGILVALALMIVVFFRAQKYNYVGTNQKYSLNLIWLSFRKAILVLLMPLIILGGIYGGIFTPTEAAIVASIYGLFLGFVVYRELKLKDLIPIFVNSALTSAMVMFVIACAQSFSWILSNEQIPAQIAAAILSITSNKYILLALITVMLLISGCFIELNASIVILAPMLMPIMTQLGVHPVHFGCFMVANLCLGLVTPPLGVNLYVACGIMKMSIGEVSKALVPILGASIAVIVLVTYIPQIALWLPRYLGLCY
ncbi:MAG: TRAP transporter large permease [Clostridiales bacterium]